MFFQSLIVRIKSLAHARQIIAGLNKEFWIGHFLIMVSTVLGVYLAAHSGLKTAVEFDAITSDRDNYYLRANLRDEVLYNINISEGIIKNIEKWGTFDRKAHPKFQSYVMDTMKEQSNTLKTPNVILSGTLQYYDRVERLIEQRKGHSLSYPALAKKLRKEIDDYKKNILSVIDKDQEELKARLAEAGVTLY